MEQVSKLESDRRRLLEARERGPVATLGAYLRMSGPGWLQSALTLGGGSLGSSLYLGVLGGTTLLWLQPTAMVLGIIMLSAIGYVALSTGKPAFKAVCEHVNPVLGWGWALASLVASMVWAMPQYSLAVGVAQQNLFPGLLAGTGGKIAATLVILVLCTAVTWAYGRGGLGVKLYELVLKIVVALVVVCFVGVVLKLGFSADGIRWGEVFAGFVPDVGALWRPAPAFLSLLEDIPAEHRGYWHDFIVNKQRDVMMSAAATAVGINMTFLFPYSIMKRGWGPEFRGLLRFDLATGMFIPFVLATSCVVLAAGSRFHAKAEHRILADEVQTFEGKPKSRMLKEFEGLLANRLGSKTDEARFQDIHPAEKVLAASLVNRDAFDLAQSLAPLTGSLFANVLFGIGVLGMTLSTITLLMLVSGFILCEMFGWPQDGWKHRLATLAAVTGALGPFVWNEAAFYLVVPTSVFALTLLPIAYLSFFLLMNQGRLLGRDLPRGRRRWAWNIAMALAAGTATAASVPTIIAKGGTIGIVLLALFAAAALAAHFKRKSRPADPGPTSAP